MNGNLEMTQASSKIKFYPETMDPELVECG
jgi:hypothetical protein